MRCPACRSPCLDTDLRCPHCQHNMLSTQPEEMQLSAASVCGLIFAALGAGTIALAPMPEDLAINQYVLVGIGGVVGGIIGAVIGIVIHRGRKNPPGGKPGPRPSAPTGGTAFGNSV